MDFCSSRGGTLVDESNPALQGFLSWELWRRHKVCNSYTMRPHFKSLSSSRTEGILVRGHLYITQGCFKAFLNHPPNYIRTFSLHKVRENCHFLDQLPIPTHLKMAPYLKRSALDFIFRNSWLMA